MTEADCLADQLINQLISQLISWINHLNRSAGADGSRDPPAPGSAVCLPLMMLGDSRVESRLLRRQAPPSSEEQAVCGASRAVTMSERSMFFRAVHRLSTDRRTSSASPQTADRTQPGPAWPGQVQTYSWPAGPPCWPTG